MKFKILFAVFALFITTGSRADIGPVDPQGPPPTTPTVHLQWNLFNDPTIVGYYLYFGTISKVYQKPIDVGNVSQITLAGLTQGVSYYFALTAYNSQRAQTAYSDEIMWTAGYSILGPTQLKFIPPP